MRNTTKTNATNENSKLESKNSSCKFYSFKCLEAKQKIFGEKKNPTMTQNNKKRTIPKHPTFPNSFKNRRNATNTHKSSEEDCSSTTAKKRRRRIILYVYSIVQREIGD
jgi:hypothetical protein